MKNYKYILFDFDGTVADTSPGVIKAAVYALDTFGIKVDNPEVSLRRFIGPPLGYSFSTFYGLKDNDSLKAIAAFREYYASKGVYDCTIYDGMEELLRKLKAYGKKVILATSKPTVFAVQILERFHLKQYFDFVSGAGMDELKNEKPEVIDYAIKQYDIDISEGVMVGDRFYDIQGAASFGMDSIGVLYGFGEEEEFKGAIAVVKNVKELESLLIQQQ